MDVMQLVDRLAEFAPVDHPVISLYVIGVRRAA